MRDGVSVSVRMRMVMQADAGVRDGVSVSVRMRMVM